MKHISLSIAVAISSLLVFSGCNKYLEAEPDYRVELDSYEKVRKLLTNGYPTSYPVVMTEYASDNIDDNGEENPHTKPFYDQVTHWQPLREYFYVDGARTTWEQHYLSISYANTALEAIKELRLPDKETAPARGEALLLRAYGHFILVNLYCKPYNKETSSSDLGIPYITATNPQLSPNNDRGTVESVYQQIAKDLEEGLPLISNSYYDSKVKQRYHFNKQAAYAFAARFYLYYQNWSKAEEYATTALEDNPEKYLRKWQAFASTPRRSDTFAKLFSSEEDTSNFLILQIRSYAHIMMSTGRYMARYSHSNRVSNRETLRANNIWGTYTSQAGLNVDPYWMSPFVTHSNYYNSVLMPKYPIYTSYNTLAVPFTADETLLVRAEARILQEKYTEAIADLNLWSSNFLNKGKEGQERQTTFTQEEIVNFYKGLSYDEANNPSLKKALHPSFSIKDEIQENLLHHLLQCRRILTLFEGLRWFDIRRYGIEIHRYEATNLLGDQVKLVETLKTNDTRNTFQIPEEVVNAKLVPNPR